MLTVHTVTDSGMTTFKEVNTMNETTENTTPVTTEESTTPEVTPEASTEEAQVFTQKEVDALIAKAVGTAVAKAKQKATQTSEERIASLEQELLVRDNKDYVRTEMAAKNIDPKFAPLFFSGDQETSDDKIALFSSQFEKAVAKAVEERLGEVKPISLHPTNPKPASNSTSFLDFYAKNTK